MANFTRQMQIFRP